MRKILSFLLLLIVSVGMQAQKDVTKFLGIPVDGSKQGMIQKLKAKGYKYDATYDVLEGEFNGTDVFIKIDTNNNKVWRICLIDVSSLDETNIRIRFNGLCNQFMKNKKYVPATLDDCFISEKEDISYEILVHKKRYDAYFFQKSESSTDAPENRIVWFTIGENAGKYYIAMYYENGYNESDGEDL